MVKWLYITLILLLSHAPLLVFAQSQKTIAVICSGASPVYKSAIESFQKHIKKSGMPFALKTFVVPKGSANNSAFSNSIKKEKPDIILAVGGRAAYYAQKSHSTIPIVFCLVSDPAYTALTGPGAVLDIAPDKQVQFIRKTFPSIDKIGIIYTKDRNKSMVNGFKKLKQQGDSRIILKGISKLEELNQSIKSLTSQADCLLMIPNTKLYSRTTLPHILKDMLNKRFPVIGFSASIAKAGSLGCVYADMDNNISLAGDGVLKILSGQKQGAQVFYPPTKIQFGVNKDIAQLLNVKIDPTQIKKATFIIGDK